MGVRYDITIRDDNRLEGRHSIYVQREHSGLWYTGLTFESNENATHVAAAIKAALNAEGAGS